MALAFDLEDLVELMAVGPLMIHALIPASVLYLRCVFGNFSSKKQQLASFFARSTIQDRSMLVCRRYKPDRHGVSTTREAANGKNRQEVTEATESRGTLSVSMLFRPKSSHPTVATCTIAFWSLVLCGAYLSTIQQTKYRFLCKRVV